MACVNSTTFYWPGSTFSAATNLYTDSNLTTVAPDGWYQQAGIWREMVGGVLGPATTCPTCIVTCDTSVTGSGGQGEYFLSAYVGPATGVILVRFDPYSFPDKCTWSFDYDNSGTPTVASEYSSSSEGYLQGLIGTITTAASQCSPPPGGYTNAAGSSGLQVTGLNRYDYDTAIAGFPTTPTSSGTQTLGPYDPQGGSPNPVDFTTNPPGASMMVIPKPYATPDTVDFIFDAPCSGTGWQMFITCPTDLNSFTCKPSPQPCTATPLLDPFFTAHPGNNTGVANAVFVNDWAFVDQYGVTKMPAGDYLVDNGTAYQCVTVGPNGVVTAVTPCSGTC